MPVAHLDDRGVVKVTGEDAKAFLEGLITCDLDKISPRAARLGGLLTPQGKILFDFIVFEAPQAIEGGYYLDVLKGHSGDLAKRLGFYKLRAKVRIEDLSETLAVVAGWDGRVRREDRAPARVAERVVEGAPAAVHPRLRLGQ